MTAPRRVALLGAGVIGAGWAARFVLNGIDVTVCDPDPEAGRKTRAVLENARRAYAKMTLAPPGAEGALSFTDAVAEAVEGADFIQESAPEIEELKTGLLGEAAALAGPEVVIASSTSGLLPSRLQAGCRHPERICVGHPFNPVYLLPLVEVVGGEATSEETKQKAMAVYEAIGMHPLHVRKEVDAFISDRLLEAVWREGLHMINEGIATTDELDQAIIYGPGLRWSFMGTFLSYRLAGGEAGMRHFLKQFGPALKLPWTKLEAPELTEELIETVARHSDEQAAGVDLRDLERLRDDCIVAVMQGLKGHDYGAGRVLKRYEEQLYRRAHPSSPGDVDIGQPLRLHERRVPAEWIDYNGHMTESRYLQVFGDASDALYRFLGIEEAYLEETGSYFTAETHIGHLSEVSAGEPVHVTTRILGFDEKRLHLFHELHRTHEDVLAATAEQMMLHVDAESGRVGPAGRTLLAKVQEIAAAQADLPWPERAGRAIKSPSADRAAGS